MPRVNQKKKADNRGGDDENEREQKSSDEELCGALLFGARARDAEGIDESFCEPGEELHGAKSE
jgi:hypothetical protein